jgi:hypothetical protein
MSRWSKATDAAADRNFGIATQRAARASLPPTTGGGPAR